VPDKQPSAAKTRSSSSW